MQTHRYPITTATLAAASRVAAVVLAFMSLPASAGYLSSGYNLQVVKSEQGLSNSALSYQTNALWSGSGLDVEMNTSFALPSAQSIGFARLYLDVWGGTNAKTATLTAFLNGTPLTTISFGGTGDANPTFSLAQPSVYGSGAGAWQIAYGGISSLLHANGTPNLLTFTVTDPGNTTFDGRTYCASLVAIYSDPSITQSLDYYLAEADGTLRTSPGSYGSPDQRTLTLSAIDTANVASAFYHAGYTHGSTSSGTNNLDQLFFNGNRLGPANNDASTGDAVNYLPNNLTFDVSTLLTTTSTVRYTVNGTELGGTGDSYLRPNIGVLEVRHVPEPGTLSLLALGGVIAFRRRKVA